MAIKNVHRSQGPKVHLLVGLLMDTSISVKPIMDKLNLYTRQLLREMRQDPTLNNIVELQVIHYNNKVKTVAEFQPLETVGDHALDITECSGATDLGGALLYMLRQLENRISDWKLKGEKVYCPVVFLFCDGTSDPGVDADERTNILYQNKYRQAAEKIRAMEAAEKIVFVGTWRNSVGSFSDARETERLMRMLSSFRERIIAMDSRDGERMDIGRFFSLIHHVTNSVIDGTSVQLALDQVLDL